MISSRARSIGPAASRALAAGASLRVHGVFPSTVTLEVLGTGRFISLCGPPGRVLPHAIVLERPEALEDGPPAPGASARYERDSILVPTERGPLVVGLSEAQRLPARALAPLPRLGAAYPACALRLAEFQAAARCELRMDGAPTSRLGAALRDCALALSGAVRAFPSGCLELLQTVSALVGLGPGLTPSGDDLLCGFLAAARASGRPGLADALAEAAEQSLCRTSHLSAFLVRSAVEGFWPTPLLDLAGELAAEQEREALTALSALCALGHSSGADLATGFLSGLPASLPLPDVVFQPPPRGEIVRARPPLTGEG